MKMKKFIVAIMICAFGALSASQAQAAVTDTDGGNPGITPFSSTTPPIPIIVRGVPVIIDYINVYNEDGDLVYQTTDKNTIYAAVTPGVYILEVITENVGVLYVDYIRP